MKKEIEKILLINAANDNSSPDVANYAVFPPLNILSLASTVAHEFKEKIEVYIYDGQMHFIHEINAWIERERPDIVGISVLSSSYKTAIEHAKAAREANAEVILGNDHAAIYGKNILEGKKGKYINYICTADIGEIVFCDFLRMLRGESKENSVPTIMRLQEINGPSVAPGEELIERKNHDYKLYLLDRIPPVDWNLALHPEFRLWRYRENFKEKYGHLIEYGNCTSVTINRARGCNRNGAGIINRCLYCGIANLSPIFSSPWVFWKEVRAAKDILDANIFYEACDNLASFTWWVGEIVKEKPANLADTKFIVYSDALEITPKLLELYKRLGVFMVNMGLDSGDDTMLQRLKGIHDSVERNRDAVRLLREHKINVYASFVLGAPGETQDSLKNTVNFAENLIKEDQLAAIEVQPLYPLSNAKAGLWLMNPQEAERQFPIRGFAVRSTMRKKLKKVAEKWRNVDNPDPEKISKDWVDIFCNVKIKELIEAASQIDKTAEAYGVSTGAAWYDRRKYCA